MPLPVSLRQVVDELAVLDHEHHAFIDKRSGELITVSDDEIRLVEEGFGPEEVPAWQREMLPKVQEVLESEGYLALPSAWDIDEYRIIARFCHAVADEDHREELLRAIRGRGAFRCFKDTLARLGLREQCDRYRDEALAEIAVDWLEEHGIPYLEQLPREP
jgi:hypothetical protein